MSEVTDSFSGRPCLTKHKGLALVHLAAFRLAQLTAHIPMLPLYISSFDLNAYFMVDLAMPAAKLFTYWITVFAVAMCIFALFRAIDCTTARASDFPTEPSLLEHENQRLREIIEYMNASQQELIRTAVNDAIRDVKRENSCLLLQIHDQAEETATLRERTLQHERDLTSLNDTLSKHNEQIRMLRMVNNELENQNHHAWSTVQSSSAQIQALKGDRIAKDDKILEIERDLDVISRQRASQIEELQAENAKKDTRINESRTKHAAHIETLDNRIAELESSGNRHQEKLLESQNILSEVLNENTFLREELEETAISAADLDKRRRKWKNRAQLRPDGPSGDNICRR